jgi:hypothetical protein
MKLPATLLQTLAVAVASIGLTGCESAPPTEPTDTPAPSASPSEPATYPQDNTPDPDPVKPRKNRVPQDCPGCGMG